MYAALLAMGFATKWLRVRRLSNVFMLSWVGQPILSNGFSYFNIISYIFSLLRGAEKSASFFIAQKLHFYFILRVQFFVYYKEKMKGAETMFVKYNPNPTGRNVGDCAVRAISRALKLDWEQAYAEIAAAGYAMGDMPSSDSVWGAVLRQNGFYRKNIPNYCPDCYTASDFCADHPKGTYVLGFGGHVATVVDGDIFDSWDSSREIPQYYWYRKE